ncbi:MAG: hypothetical protein C0483_17280 [Pirellula sp.]|nr:hypothetical protein [Pirellula sp.]
MSLLNADFSELYRRHLCRHSQFGINVLHLVAVVGIYISLLALLLKLPAAPWIIGVLLTAYLAVLAKNVPAFVMLLVAVVIAALLGVTLLLPAAPIWLHLLLLVGWHRFQVWNHRIYHNHFDMSEFQGKYRKGPALFVMLAVYELPILLNYFLAHRLRSAAVNEA